MPKKEFIDKRVEKKINRQNKLDDNQKRLAKQKEKTLKPIINQR